MGSVSERECVCERERETERACVSERKRERERKADESSTPVVLSLLHKIKKRAMCIGHNFFFYVTLWIRLPGPHDILMRFLPFAVYSTYSH